MLQIRSADLNFEREPLVKPFGFKGGYLSEIWQSVVRLENMNGNTGIGLGTQSVLWSDAGVFSRHTESGGNALMLAMTEFALGYLKGKSFADPITQLEELLPVVEDYGKFITQTPDLRTTFALNALVAVDFAAWILYARSRNIKSFDELIPEAYKSPLSHRNDQVASIPIVSYNTPIADIVAMVEAEYFVLKVKLGAPGSQKEMLLQDKERISMLHELLSRYETPFTVDGNIPYYLDANGRYEDKKTLEAFLDHADSIGAMDRIAILEEPFPEPYEADVSDLGVRLAADESAHTDRDALHRIEMGYSAIALKPIAKTLSMTLKIAQCAHERGIPCFCADLTVNPILVEWNKSVAGRLAPFPGIGLPLLETNGHQNYKYWDRMKTYLVHPDAPWVEASEGVFHLDDTFYDQSAGILDESSHYEALFT